MNIYLVRHGQTDCNVKRVFYGWTDCDINDTGVKQAEALKEFFKSVKYDRVIVSPLLRAKRTAEIIVDKKAVPIESFDTIKEMNFGQWENRTFKDIQENENNITYSNLTDWFNVHVPEGENFDAFYNRVKNGIHDIIQKFNGEDLLIVSHSGPMSVMLCEFSGLGKNGFWKFKPKHSCYSKIEILDGFTILDTINAHVEF